MVYYFAYGSNMSEEQIRERLGREVIGEKGMLNGFELIFKKQAYKKPGISYANIINKEGSEVQGAIYKISEEELAEIDRKEGYPNHYNRIVLIIKNEDGIEIPSVVYIANCSKSSRFKDRKENNRSRNKKRISRNNQEKVGYLIC